MAPRYKIESPDGKIKFIKEYKGDIKVVAKKAWRDAKLQCSPPPIRIEITNMDTEETYDFDFSGWSVAAKVNKRFYHQRSKVENAPDIERKHERDKRITDPYSQLDE